MKKWELSFILANIWLMGGIVSGNNVLKIIGFLFIILVFIFNFYDQRTH